MLASATRKIVDPSKSSRIAAKTSTRGDEYKKAAGEPAAFEKVSKVELAASYNRRPGQKRRAKKINQKTWREKT